jgi:hypothetical protein
MSAEETKEAIKVMQAYVDGKDIEVRFKSSLVVDDWDIQTAEPKWNWSVCRYRISESKIKDN